MGLFSFLFKKKDKDIKEEHQRHFCEEKVRRSPSKPREYSIVTNDSQLDDAQKIAENTDNIQVAKLVTKTKETDVADVVEEAEADVIAKDDTSASIKINGFGGAFDIKRSKDGRFVFNLYAANRVIVATSQIYSSSQSAVNGINSVIANAHKAGIEDKTLKSLQTQAYPKWEIYLDKGAKYRFRLFATNGSCILHSQGYTQKSTCKKGIESVIRTCKTAKIDKSYLNKE